jgi:carbon-monoxide dehydrogenase large subunit
MPFKTGLTFTYDSGEFEEEHGHGAQARRRGLREAPRRARKRGKLRGLGMSNTIERAAAGLRGRRDPVRQVGRGRCSQAASPKARARDHLQADRLRQARDRPEEVYYIQGDFDQVFLGEGTGGSRSATLGSSAVDAAADKITAKGKKIAAHVLKVDAAEVNFADGVFSSPKTNRTLTIKEVADIALDPAKLPKDMEVGLIATATYTAPVQNFPNGCHICELDIDQDTGEVEIVRYSVVDDVGTVLNPLLLKGQIVGGVAQGVGQILMEDIRFDDDGQILTGSFMDYAMPRATDIQRGRGQEQPVRTATNPLGVKGAGEARLRGRHAGGRQCAGRRALASRHPPRRDAGDAERLWRAINQANGS